MAFETHSEEAGETAQLQLDGKMDRDQHPHRHLGLRLL